MSYAMYPAVFDEFAVHVNTFGDVSKLKTEMILQPLSMGEEYIYEVEEGRKFYIRPVAMGEVDAATGMQDVFFELNGEPKQIQVQNQSSAATTVTRSKADASKLNQVGAPMAGKVLEVRVSVGTPVSAGDPLCLLSAMKMETVVSAPMKGVVQSVEVTAGESVGAQDLLITINPPSSLTGP